MRMFSLFAAIALLTMNADQGFAQRDTDVYFRQSTENRDLAVTEVEVDRGAEVRFRVSRVGDGRDAFSISFDFAPGRNIDRRLRKQFTNVRQNEYIAFGVAQRSRVVFSDSTGQFRRISRTQEWTSVEFGTGAVVELKVFSRGRF